jgi:uncharacterized YigZ family protein
VTGATQVDDFIRAVIHRPDGENRAVQLAPNVTRGTGVVEFIRACGDDPRGEGTGYGRGMRTVRAAGTRELLVQRSRFICALGPARTPEEATAFVEAVRREHWSATHHCTAYRVGPHAEHQRSNDDGEPAGTAGVPMLTVLVNRDITDTVAVVTRYFGGVKLGTGGLVRAYGRCVTDALDAIGTLALVPHTAVTVTVGSAAAGRLEHDLRTAGFEVTGADYAPATGSSPTFQVLVPTDDLAAFTDWLARVTAGGALATPGEQALRAVPAAG